MNASEIRFAKSGEVHLAYQRWGEGPDLVLIPPLISNVELGWDQEIYRRAREHLGRYVHVLEFDKRGIGNSDRFMRAPTLEERIGDIAAVMDAEGLERANLFGLSEGGIMAQFFAATYPERVDRVVLLNSAIGLSAVPELSAYSDDGLDPAEELARRLASLERMAETWGRDPQVFVDLFCPSQSGNPAFVRWAGRLQRMSASPTDFRRQLDSVVTLDAASKLGAITAPTLVINISDDRVVHPACGRYLAAKISTARFAEFPGEDHFIWAMAGWRAPLDAVIEFITGTSPTASIERRFATVLFTDVVGSTTRAASVGDAEWRRTMEGHDRLAWQVINEHHGKLVKNMGDGLLATFDSPSNAIRSASELRGKLAEIDLSIRAGVHAGELEVRENGDVVGLAVNLAARVEQCAANGSVYVSSTVRDLLLGGEYSFEDRGEHELQGIAGTWRLFELAI